MSTRSYQPMRWVLLLLLLAIVAGVACDLSRFAADGATITALRTKPAGTADEGEGSVDAFCGFAPCGMPLECN